MSATALGVVAVVGMVVAFSLSASLAKRANSPGVLLAFWRMVIVSVVWNVVLGSTGRRITMRNVRQAFVPGVFFGLNLSFFFVGATHNSVVNTVLIGSLAPLLIVPVGGVLFKERIDSRALVFALLAFVGVAVVIVGARSGGAASLKGDVFCVISMSLLVAYIAATKHFREGMDVTTFMATVCPIAAVAVLPLAIARGHGLLMSGTGWVYVLILSFTSGVAGHGLMVFAQKSIQIGTIGIAKVAEPVLAVVFSFVLLGEVVNHRQVVGIGLAVSGLLGFTLVHHHRDHRRPRNDMRASAPAARRRFAALR